MNGREEAAAKANFEAVTGKPWEEAPAMSARLCREDSAAIIKAADAHDAAHGVHRVSLDDATVERAARALFANDPDPDVIGLWGHLYDTEREYYFKQVRAVLAAAVGGDGE